MGLDLTASNSAGQHVSISAFLADVEEFSRSYALLCISILERQELWRPPQTITGYHSAR